ncbi:hypothetical protein ASF50_10890 [Nocardioides sp. Leaf307]|nr:hypothetical protein ASF47_03440 [Nocardioides sp. Leaf285]KQQ41497.1 hypothetical protein ASF50_10890 [Nocardioides sp. Leaf307]
MVSDCPGVGASSIEGPATGVAATSSRPATRAQQLPGWRPSATSGAVRRSHAPRSCSTWASASSRPSANHDRYAGSHCSGAPSVWGPTRVAPSRCHQAVTTTSAAMPTRTRAGRRPRAARTRRRPSSATMRAGSAR